MLDKEIIALSQGLYSPLFATRDSIREAITYAYGIAKASENPAAITTALHIPSPNILKTKSDSNTEPTWKRSMRGQTKNQGRAKP